MNPVSALGVTAFEDRLAQADVQCVVFEAVWGKWSHDLAIAHGRLGTVCRKVGLRRCPFPLPCVFY